MLRPVCENNKFYNADGNAIIIVVLILLLAVACVGAETRSATRVCELPLDSGRPHVVSLASFSLCISLIRSSRHRCMLPVSHPQDFRSLLRLTFLTLLIFTLVFHVPNATHFFRPFTLTLSFAPLTLTYLSPLYTPRSLVPLASHSLFQYHSLASPLSRLSFSLHASLLHPMSSFFLTYRNAFSPYLAWPHVSPPIISYQVLKKGGGSWCTCKLEFPPPPTKKREREKFNSKQFLLFTSALRSPLRPRISMKNTARNTSIKSR